jgi:hypothetical protein
VVPDALQDCGAFICRTVMPSFSRIKLSKKNSYFSWTTDPEDQKHHNPLKHWEPLTVSSSNTAAHSGRPQSLALPPCEPEISRSYIYTTLQCLIPHYSNLHCHFVSWGTVFGPYVRNWNAAAISLGICCCLVLYSAVQLKL